jgi:hypothetical protein
MLVASSEIAVMLEHVIADDWFPSQRARRGDRALEVVLILERAGGCDERDASAGLKRSW